MSGGNGARDKHRGCDCIKKAKRNRLKDRGHEAEKQEWTPAASSHKPALQYVASSGALSGWSFLPLHTTNGIMSTTGKLQLNSCVYSFPTGTQLCVDAKSSAVILSLFSESSSGFPLLRYLLGNNAESN